MVIDHMVMVDVGHGKQYIGMSDRRVVGGEIAFLCSRRRTLQLARPSNT